MINALFLLLKRQLLSTTQPTPLSVLKHLIALPNEYKILFNQSLVLKNKM
jgi:hypothetical protein